MKDVILHAFDWKYSDILNNADSIAEIGFGAVLISPPLYSTENVKEWWQRYQPKDYRILRSYLGRKNDIVKLIEKLHSLNVKVYADMVFNHMANEKGMSERKDDPYNFPGNYELSKYKTERESFEADKIYGNLDNGLFSPQDFNPQGDITNWLNSFDVEERWLSGLPDLELNDWVISQQRECLKALNNLGFDGYRVDALKHMPIEHVRSVFQSDDMKDKFVFGESLTSNDNEEAAFIWPLLRVLPLPCYDFPLHETLLRVFGPSGNMRELSDPAAYKQALPWNQAVTFTVTHDIPNNDGFRGLIMNAQDEYLANGYIMGRDGGVPLVYSDNNQSTDKYPQDYNRWAGAWQRNDIKGMIQFHNAVHGCRQWILGEGDGFIIIARGDKGIVAINKTENWQSATFSTYGLIHGNYQCTIHNLQMNLSGNEFRLQIPPRELQMWLLTNAIEN